jgi:diphosphomevalonate decarboxylase
MLSTFEATPNIALIKYWGKRDKKLVLPQNGSMSITLDSNTRTVTSAVFSHSLKNDVAWINGKKTSAEEMKRLLIPVNIVRKQAGIDAKIAICSNNNFPTAAGIASSASGFAALACAASDAAGLKLSSSELSILARHGSGSACRSVLGGFVEWKAGEHADGRDSYAVQIAPASHWPQMRDLIAIVAPEKKKIGSSEGMDMTVKTSRLFKERVGRMPKKLEKMRNAILQKDTETIYSIAMADSDEMHATMADTKPPIVYLNEASRKIIRAINEINSSEGRLICGYTFDAGPNAHIIAEEKNIGKVRKALSQISGIEKFIKCGIGNGPRKLGEKESLLSEDGTPK